MPYSTTVSDVDYKKQTIRNINQLMNDEPLNIAECLQYFKESYMLKFFEVYQEFVCESSAFLHSVLTTIGALSDDTSLSSVISHNDMSINLMTHIVAEPGEKCLLFYQIFMLYTL